MSVFSPPRIRQIEERIHRIRERIERACARAGRSADSVTLIAVTKTFPIEVVQAALEAGVTDFGENRVQELDQKVALVPGELAGGPLKWHLVGSLQRNKAKKAAQIADVFHAVDSARLARELDKRAREAGRVIPCFVQVNVSGEESKFGVNPGETHDFLDELSESENLRIMGLMTLAAPAENPEEVRPQFRLLFDLLENYRGRADAGKNSGFLSMGMSSDFEVAIEEGATHIRIGTAIFGERDG